MNTFFSLKTLCRLLLFMSLVIFLLFALFWLPEFDRNLKINKYQKAGLIFINSVKEKSGPLSHVFQEKENIVCSLDSYSSADSLRELSNSQRKLIPKSIIPSTDQSTYLLFFTDYSLSRIYLFDNHKITLRFSGNEPRCANSSEIFSIETTRDSIVFMVGY